MHNKPLVSETDTIQLPEKSKLPVGTGGPLKCDLLSRVGAEGKETRQLS